jgi:hypothetical protein
VGHTEHAEKMRNVHRLLAVKSGRRLGHRWGTKILKKHDSEVKITSEEGPLMVNCECSVIFKYYTCQKTIHCIGINILFTS